MKYVIRQRGTEWYIDDDGRFGPLEKAYVYGALKDARGEVAPDEEIVEVALTAVKIVENPKPESEG